MPELKKIAKFIITCTAVFIPISAFAGGGISRDGQDVSFMYEDGDFATVTLRSVTPSVTGSSFTQTGGPANISESVGPQYSTYQVNYRQSAGEKKVKSQQSERSNHPAPGQEGHSCACRRG